MGIILSRFKKKVSTKEKLQIIQEEIVSLEEYKEHTEQRRKKLVGSFVAFSIFFYLLAAAVCYFYYLPPTWKEKLLYSLPFLGTIVIIYFIKAVLTWYYRWKVRRNENKLESLKMKKEDILNQVIETETYKVAKDILETFAPETIRKASITLKTPVVSPVASGHRMPMLSSGEVRRRIVSPKANQSFGPRPVPTPIRSSGPPPPPFAYGRPSITPRPQQPMMRPNLNTSSHGPRLMYSSVSPMNSHTYSRPDGGPVHPASSSGGEPPGPPMPRPILPRERGMLDRFVEYLVGDGPSNRYALVCRQCESHNGMALKEEFLYIGFRCAYCYYWNPARKQRPTAPRLEAQQSRRLTAEMATRRKEEEMEEEESSSTEEEDVEEEESESVSGTTSRTSSDDEQDLELRNQSNETNDQDKKVEECPQTSSAEDGETASESPKPESALMEDSQPGLSASEEDGKETRPVKDEDSAGLKQEEDS